MGISAYRLAKETGIPQTRLSQITKAKRRVTTETSREMRVAHELTIAFPKEPTEYMDYTDLQGQYLSYIYHYSVIHGRAPSEADFRDFFGTTPPTIHNMILKLEEKGLIGRVPRQPRSIRLLIPPQRLPVLRPATRRPPWLT